MRTHGGQPGSNEFKAELLNWRLPAFPLAPLCGSPNRNPFRGTTQGSQGESRETPNWWLTAFPLARRCGSAILDADEDCVRILRGSHTGEPQGSGNVATQTRCLSKGPREGREACDHSQTQSYSCYSLHVIAPHPDSNTLSEQGAARSTSDCPLTQTRCLSKGPREAREADNHSQTLHMLKNGCSVEVKRQPLLKQAVAGEAMACLSKGGCFVSAKRLVSAIGLLALPCSSWFSPNLGGARTSQEEPGGATRSREEPRGAQEEPGAGRARRSQEEPGRARGSHEEPRGATRTSFWLLLAPPDSSWLLLARPGSKISLGSE